MKEKIYKLDAMGNQVEVTGDEMVLHLRSIIQQANHHLDKYFESGASYNGCDIDAGILSSRIYFLDKKD